MSVCWSGELGNTGVESEGVLKWESGAVGV